MTTPSAGDRERDGSLVHGHTVSWADGLVVTRLFISRRQMYLRITWNGVQRELRLGSRVGEFISLGERVNADLRVEANEKL